MDCGLQAIVLITSQDVRSDSQFQFISRSKVLVNVMRDVWGAIVTKRPNTGKLLFVKLSHFLQKFSRFLVGICCISILCCPSVQTSPGLGWCGHCLDSGPIGEGNPVQLRHPPPTVGKLTDRWIFLIPVIISIHYLDKTHYN